MVGWQCLRPCRSTPVSRTGLSIPSRPCRRPRGTPSAWGQTSPTLANISGKTKILPNPSLNGPFPGPLVTLGMKTASVWWLAVGSIMKESLWIWTAMKMLCMVSVSFNHFRVFNKFDLTNISDIFTSHYKIRLSWSVVIYVSKIIKFILVSLKIHEHDMTGCSR